MISSTENREDQAESPQGGIMGKKFNRVYQFKITLKGAKPPVWRRIQAPGTYTFWDLHVAIQNAMSWSDSHLHQFEMVNPSTGMKVEIGIPGEEFELDREILPEQKQKIANYFSMENKLANYTYDFGDGWEHTIRLEKILPREGNIDYPVCTGGERACPPEDCGGIGGYEEICCGESEFQEEYSEYDPEHFDVKEISFRRLNKR